MSRTFVHDGHTYTFTRLRGVVTVTRDDGATVWNTYPSFCYDKATGQWVTCIAAHQPSFGTIAEIKSLITNGHTDHGTFVHQVVWAKTADEARRVREEADNG